MQIRQITIRPDRQLADAADIIASVLGQSLSEYILEALRARVETDVPDNLQAYEAVRAAREKQQKGA